MTTQDFTSDLWGRYCLIYKNEAIFKSHNPAPTPSASTTLTTQPHNPSKSKGMYKAPIQIIHFAPPSNPPHYRERFQMNPLEQKEESVQLNRIAAPDPRKNVTGNHVTYENRLENMDIQEPRFNYSSVIGIVGILISVGIIVWLARGRKT